MLDALRTATRGFVGRTLMTVVMGLLIASFAIWGIGDIFRGFRAGDIAKVGKTSISVDAYRDAYQNELQRLQRQAGRAVTSMEARLLGVDQQVLARLVGDATLDQEARALGLAVSDQEVMRKIADEPMFKGPSGQLDRARFEAFLRKIGTTERALLVDLRHQALRTQITDALTHGIEVPQAMLEAIFEFQTESRTVDYIVLPAAVAGTIPDPSQEELKTYFEERQEAYGVPEYRSFVTVSVTPASLAKPDDVSDADAQKRYDEIKAERYGTPEKRTVEQVVFPDEATAKAARASLDGGKTFEDVLAEKNLSPKDASLGTLPRAAFADKNVAETVFSLPQGGVSTPITTPFGSVLVRVTEIVPATMKPYSEVAAELKREIATQRARAEVARVHDKIEDLRASGKSLAEAAQEVGVEPRKIGGIDAAGTDFGGKQVPDIAEDASLMKAVFASDVGVDNETLRTRDGGYQWFEVTGVTPARQKGYGEVKPEVEKAWRDDEIARRLAAKAAEVVKRIEAGETLAALAASEGNLEVKQASGVKRATTDGPVGKAVTQIYDVGLKGAGSAELDDNTRLVFQVVAAEIPPFDATDATLVSAKGHVRQELAEDVRAQYLVKLQNELGTKVNEQALATAIGGSSDLF